jgi:hypothetical protein
VPLLLRPPVHVLLKRKHDDLKSAERADYVKLLTDEQKARLLNGLPRDSDKAKDKKKHKAGA